MFNLIAWLENFVTLYDQCHHLYRLCCLSTLPGGKAVDGQLQHLLKDAHVKGIYRVTGIAGAPL
jgi:hypothetical protein